jgi:DNA-binding transcriptional ArsR family regulator
MNVCSSQGHRNSKVACATIFDFMWTAAYCGNMPKPKNGEAIRDLRHLRAFAHPLRVRLYYELGLRSAATVSDLAAAVTEPISLVSYHLHQLAGHGFIEPAPELARDNRERWWRLSEQRRMRLSVTDFLDQPGGLEAAAAIQQSVATLRAEQIERFLQDQQHGDREWLEAAFSDDGVLMLTVEELKLLHEELAEVIKRFRERADSKPEPDRRRTMLIIHGFPYTPKPGS